MVDHFISRELVLMLLQENDIYSPAVFNADEGTMYNTHDILERHPTRPDLYRVVER